MHQQKKGEAVLIGFIYTIDHWSTTLKKTPLVQWERKLWL
ncbi:MAG: hypothetical protein RIR12_1234 [Bacteroidota bacterium]